MSFLLSLKFSLQQNRRTRGWNRVCPEVCVWGSKQTIYTHMNKCKNDKMKERKEGRRENGVRQPCFLQLTSCSPNPGGVRFVPVSSLGIFCNHREIQQ
jgi:hypothetical protein